MGKIKTTIPSKVILINILFLMLSIFFYPHLSPLFTFFLLIFSFSFSKNKGNNLKKNYKSILIFSSLFWIYLAGLTHTENMDAGITDVILKFSFLVFPLIFGVMNKDLIQRKDLFLLLDLFIFISTSSAIVCLGNATWKFFNNGVPDAFFYGELSFLVHPSYYALYLNVALTAIICKLFITNQIINSTLRIFYWISIPFYILFIILLESKAGLLGLFSVIGIAVLYLLIYERKIKEAVRLGGISIVFVTLIILFLPQTTNRVNAVVESMEEESTASEHSVAETRLYLWKAALNAFKEEPVWGYGTGDVKEELIHQYEIQHNQRALDANYNPHNQFLQTMVANGLIGLIALLILVVYPILLGFFQRRPFLFLLGFLMLINLLVESMFERQAGVMFYAFFNSLLFFHFKDEKV